MLILLLDAILFYFRPDYTVVGGTKLVGDGCTDIRNEDRDMIRTFCDDYFPWLKVTVRAPYF